MSDIKLFRTDGQNVTPLEGHSVALEKSLQTLIEQHLDVFLGIRFLASEYSTGPVHGGRIDTLGLDENGCPCIIEYKRASNENVINQGLFYLDWLMDHRGQFELLVQKTLGPEAAEEIAWSSPRLLCIAGGFNKYDGHAVKQMNRNIELIRYLRFGDELLLLELVNAVQAEKAKSLPAAPSNTPSNATVDKTLDEKLAASSPELQDLFEQIAETCAALGDDVQRLEFKHYVVFKRLKNFAELRPYPGKEQVRVLVGIDPDTITLEDGFTRDERTIGHTGSRVLGIYIRSAKDLQRALPLLQQSYEAS